MTDPLNPTPLRSLTVAELDAYRVVLGAKKLNIRRSTLDAGCSIKSALPLLQPYTQRIAEINAEEERRQTEATEARRAKRQANVPDLMLGPRADLERVVR